MDSKAPSVCPIRQPSSEHDLLLDVRLHKEVKAENSPPMLEATVQSRCYRLPATPTETQDNPPTWP